MNNKGFTLIELLVVVLIIGILAGVALPQYQKAVTKSRLATLKPLVESLSQATEAYKVASGESRLSSLELLDIEIPTPTGTEYKDDLQQLWIYYPWGQCILTYQDAQQYISCRNTTSHIRYVRYLTGTTEYSTQRACVALDNSTVAEEICKQETKSTTPFWQGVPGGETSYNKVFAYSD